MTSTTMTPFLARVLRVDAALSGLTALALLADADPLSNWLGLPAGALRALGALLVPWAALLAWLHLPHDPRALIGARWWHFNFLLVVDCALGAFGFRCRKAWAWLCSRKVQAIGTFVIAELEWVGLRQATPVRGA